MGQMMSLNATQPQTQYRKVKDYIFWKIFLCGSTYSYDRIVLDTRPETEYYFGEKRLKFIPINSVNKFLGNKNIIAEFDKEVLEKIRPHSHQTLEDPLYKYAIFINCRDFSCASDFDNLINHIREERGSPFTYVCVNCKKHLDVEIGEKFCSYTDCIHCDITQPSACDDHPCLDSFIKNL